MAGVNAQPLQTAKLPAGEGLQASSKGARVGLLGAVRTVLDGPLAGTKELIAGFRLIQARSKDEAIEWARRVPFEGGEIGLSLRISVRRGAGGRADTPYLEQLRQPAGSVIQAVLHPHPRHARLKRRASPALTSGGGTVQMAGCRAPSHRIMTAGHRIDARGANATRVTLTLGWSGLAAPLVRLLFGKLSSRYVELEAEGLKRCCEAP